MQPLPSNDPEHAPLYRRGLGYDVLTLSVRPWKKGLHVCPCAPKFEKLRRDVRDAHLQDMATRETPDAAQMVDGLLLTLRYSDARASVGPRRGTLAHDLARYERRPTRVKVCVMVPACC